MTDETKPREKNGKEPQDNLASGQKKTVCM